MLLECSRSRIPQAQAETVETATSQEQLLFSGHVGTESSNKEGIWCFGLTLAFPGHCILRHYLFPLQGGSDSGEHYQEERLEVMHSP